MIKLKILMSLLLWQGAVHAQTPASILLTNATIIDGDASVKPRIGSVLIENGLVKSVSYAAVKAKSKTQVIDCAGKFITPGLMDSHVHLGTGDVTDFNKAHVRNDSIMYNLVVHGITTVRDMAGNAAFLAECKKKVQEGKVTGPDIYYAAQFAGPGYFEMMGVGGRDDENLGKTPWYRAISSSADVKPAITDAKNVGVTGIKIYASLSKELIREITNEAHKQGLLAWAHGAIFPSKPMDVALSNVNSMSHANDLVFQQIKGDTINIGTAWAQLYKGLKLDSNVRDQMLLEMKKRGTFLDPTVFHAENNNMATAVLITRRANELGVKIVAGTDWIFPTKNESVPLLDEMKLLKDKCGLSSLQVIEAATINGALVTGLKDRGLVRKGKRADLLILNTDPLQSLDTFDQPAFVIKQGKVVVQSGML